MVDYWAHNPKIRVRLPFPLQSKSSLHSASKYTTVFGEDYFQNKLI